MYTQKRAALLAKHVLARSCFLLLGSFILFSISPVAMAHSRPMSAPGSDPTLQINVGFQSTFRIGKWTPVQVVMSGGSADFSGLLTIRVYAGPPHSSIIGILSPWQFQQSVTLRRNTQKQVTLNVPYFIGTSTPTGIIARLFDTRGRTIATQTSTNGYVVNPGDLFIGLLTDLSTGFDAIQGVTLPNQTSSPTTSTLDATSMPGAAAILSSFDMIVLDNFNTGTLNPAQIAALQSWVNQGGVLVEVGGAAWQRTLSPLPPALLPVVLTGTTTLPPGTTLLPDTGQTVGQKSTLVSVKAPLTISTATERPQASFSTMETLLSSGTTPLMVQAQQGQGFIFYLAFDPARPPLDSWPNTNSIWKSLLLQTLGDKFLISNSGPNFNSGPGQIALRGSVVNALAPQSQYGPWIIITLLVSYILLLGPIRLLLIRRWKWQRQGWIMIASCIVLFSFLSYGLAFYQRGAALTDNSLSLIQFNQDGSTAHVTTYMGMYVPNQGNYDLALPKNALAQPVAMQFLVNSPSFLAVNDPEATLSTGNQAADLRLDNVGSWSFHPIVIEQERQVTGELKAQLSLRNSRISGTLTNTLNTSVSDAYILLAHTVIPLGKLSAGETITIDQPLNVTGRSGMTLVDQIARSGGLPTAYAPFAHSGQPQNDFQRHVALLSALNGTGYSFPLCGGSCQMRAISSNGNTFVTGGGVPNPRVLTAPDTLLLPGSMATLIGWADQPLDGVDALTVNGVTPGGRHDNLIQMPLTLTNPQTIPPGFISGRVVDIQSFDAQTILPGVYTLATGSITFEFTLPNRALSSLTVNEPDLLAGASGPASNISHLQANLYNWHTRRWDAISLNRDLYSTSSPRDYIGLGGRILLQISNQDTKLGKLFFGKPSIQAS